MMRVDEIAKSLMWLFKTIIVAGLVALGWFAMDRTPPFAVLDTPPAFARPGEWLRMTAEVRRDTSRNCDTTFSRYLFDANATRYDLGHSIMSAQMIAAMEKRHPGKLPIAVLVPMSAEPGQARIVTVLEYRCNKVHNLWPITVTAEFPFVIQP